MGLKLQASQHKALYYPELFQGTQPGKRKKATMQSWPQLAITSLPRPKPGSPTQSANPAAGLGALQRAGTPGPDFICWGCWGKGAQYELLSNFSQEPTAVFFRVGLNFIPCKPAALQMPQDPLKLQNDFSPFWRWQEQLASLTVCAFLHTQI